MNNNIYDSEYCRVTYMEADHVVLLTWKKFCCFDDYRKPTMFASDLLKKYDGSNFVIDARNGFEDVKEDVVWGFRTLLPDMAKSSCKACVFILQELTGNRRGNRFMVGRVQKIFPGIQSTVLYGSCK